jgi:hypothetical protein
VLFKLHYNLCFFNGPHIFKRLASQVYMNVEHCGHMYSHHTIKMSSNTSWLAREFKLTKTSLYLEHHNQDSAKVAIILWVLKKSNKMDISIKCFMEQTL